MPRKKETIVAVATETKATEVKPTTKQTAANEATKTAKATKNESPSLPSTVTAKAITPTPKPKKVPQPKPKTITRTELIQEVAKAVGQYMEITNRDAEAIVAEIINAMTDSLKEGNEIEIRGFGAFRIRKRQARHGRNPKTGAPVAVPSKAIVYFKIGKTLKQILLK